ncbi:RNA-directed DNA polymerase, eukaryota, reverse transcriptase zinc-binding domain protein [Tanacetum coccineum]
MDVAGRPYLPQSQVEQHYPFDKSSFIVLLNVKSIRNKNKKDVNANDVCNEVLDSQNDEHVEKMNDSQTRVIRETVKVERDMNDVNYKVNEEVEGTDMATESDNSRNSQNADSHKDNDEGKKISYAKIVNKSSLDNKLNLIPTEVNDDGIEVDPSVSLDKAQPCKLPLWVKLRNLPLEAWSSKGISVVASRLGTPLIMDQITTNMCNLGNGRPGFARVLVDVEAGKGLPEKIDILYKNKEGVVTGNKSVNVSYDWAPPICTCCKVFSHNDKNCGSRPRTLDEFMEDERNDLKQKQVNVDFVQVQHRKRGANMVNVRDGNKKYIKGIKSNNVMYKPVKKGNSKAGEKTSHGNREFQMNEKGISKTNWNTTSGGTEQLNGGSNAKSVETRRGVGLNSFQVRFTF